MFCDEICISTVKPTLLLRLLLLLQKIKIKQGHASEKKNLGVTDESVLESLDSAHHRSLSFNCAVVVDDTNTSTKGHCNGHVSLGDCVHR